ncbi:MAG: hypothetical protein DRH76_01310 [Deltaproteobacteria bacterium]|nr:MAG: hypothetical protein DRH76_01310 [Deltaproteobacteria bacterium]
MSIRDTDPRHSIHLSRVDYHDTDGKLLRRYKRISRSESG